jgi:hypothetical protein
VPHRFDGGFRAGCRRDENHRDAGVNLPNALVNLNTAHVGKRDVQEDNIRLTSPDVVNGIAAASDKIDLQARGAKAWLTCLKINFGSSSTSRRLAICVVRKVLILFLR